MLSSINDTTDTTTRRQAIIRGSRNAILDVCRAGQGLWTQERETGQTVGAEENHAAKLSAQAWIR
jgi:hypothetical protein